MGFSYMKYRLIFFFSFLYRKKMDKTWVFVDRTGLGCWWITGWALKKKKKVIAPPPLRPAPPPGAPRCCPGLRRILRRAVLRQSGMSRPRWEVAVCASARSRSSPRGLDPGAEAPETAYGLTGRPRRPTPPRRWRRAGGQLHLCGLGSVSLTAIELLLAWFVLERLEKAGSWQWVFFLPGKG